MHTGDDKISALQREVDEARARLAATVTELQHRLSPPIVARRRFAAARGVFVDSEGRLRGDFIKNVAVVAGTALTVYVVVRRAMS